MEFNGASVLLVEDDPTIAMGVVGGLEHEHFAVTHVSSGEAALALAMSEAAASSSGVAAPSMVSSHARCMARPRASTGCAAGSRSSTARRRKTPSPVTSPTPV